MMCTGLDPERQPDPPQLCRGSTVHHLRSTGSERASGWSHQLLGPDHSLNREEQDCGNPDSLPLRPHRFVDGPR